MRAVVHLPAVHQRKVVRHGQRRVRRPDLRGQDVRRGHALRSRRRRVDDCTGAACPTGQTCKAGACVAAPSMSSSSASSSGGLVFGSGGMSGHTTSQGASGTGGANTGGASSFGGGATTGTGWKSACGCRVPGESGGGEEALALAGVALAFAASRRRRNPRG